MTKHKDIVHAAKKLFRKYGVKKTTMRDIAAEAGLAVGTLYLYFKNRDEVILASAQVYIDAHKEASQLALSGDDNDDAAARLREYITNRFRASKETRTSEAHSAEIARAVLRVCPSRLDDERRLMFETVVQLLQKGKASKCFRITDPARDAKVFLYSIAWFFPIGKSEFIDEPEESALLESVDWFIEKWALS